MSVLMSKLSVSPLLSVVMLSPTVVVVAHVAFVFTAGGH